MPLGKNNKNSLHHKGEGTTTDELPYFLLQRSMREPMQHYMQEVPQSPLLSKAPRLGNGLSASLTVEAALVFPLFLFALTAILFFFRVMQVSQITAGALTATGSFLSLEAEKEEEPLMLAVGYFQKELAGQSFSDSALVGGRLGISWSESDLSGEYVDLRIHYQCKLPFRMFGLGNIPVSQRVYMKKWTGYPGGANGEETERFVYITQTGKVYHVSRDCTHLKLSTRIMECEAAKNAGYTPCGFCGAREHEYTFTYFYVTDEGRRYHTVVDCLSLKRTVYRIPFSEVGERPACSRCGGGE